MKTGKNDFRQAFLRGQDLQLHDGSLLHEHVNVHSLYNYIVRAFDPYILNTLTLYHFTVF